MPAVFRTTHCVGCCGPNIEVFEELWGAPILAGYLFPDLCCHSPAGGGDTGGEMKRVSKYMYVQ